MKKLLSDNNKILMEAAVVERLRRSSHFKLHSKLVNAPLIYDEYGKKALTNIYQEYADIAEQSKIPLLLCTPTWRANHSRVMSSNVPMSINRDAVDFLVDFRSLQENSSNLKTGGLIGCKNDCYQPSEGLSKLEAQNFHSWQIEQLASSKVDYLIAETLPNVEEALGIAKAMELTGIPYIISFVISRDGLILDGTTLLDAVNYIDENTNINPLGYMVNCIFPSFISPEIQPLALFERLIGCQANASSLDHCDLEEADNLESNPVSEWGSLMIELNKKYGIKILGGCCGTNIEHLNYIANH